MNVKYLEGHRVYDTCPLKTRKEDPRAVAVFNSVVWGLPVLMLLIGTLTRS